MVCDEDEAPRETAERVCPGDGAVVREAVVERMLLPTRLFGPPWQCMEVVAVMTWFGVEGTLVTPSPAFI